MLYLRVADNVDTIRAAVSVLQTHDFDYNLCHRSTAPSIETLPEYTRKISFCSHIILGFPSDFSV